jgi:hypothetical protein
VVNVAALEESLHDAIYLLAGGENPAVNVLTAGLPFRALVDKFGALCSAHSTPRAPTSEVTAYCGHLGSLNDERNAIIHSAWNLREGRGSHRRSKRTAKPKGGFSLNVKNVTAGEIRDIADKFVAAEKKLWEYVP